MPRKKADDLATKKRQQSARTKKPPQSAPAKEPQKERDEKGRLLPGHSRRWTPGTSGNPKGRPKVKTLSEAYRNYLAEPDPSDPERTRAEAAAEDVFSLITERGNFTVAAAKEMADRTEGRPRQAVEIDIKKLAAERLARALGIPVERLPYGSPA